MDRRNLLKAIPAIVATPLVIKGKEVGKVLKTDPTAKYMVFVDGDMIDASAVAQYETALPAGTVIHTVFVQPNKTIDDAIRIYEVK